MREIIENRLIDFAVSIIDLCSNLKNGYASQHLAKQIIRSSTSSALNYGEVQGAESRKDFIHKTSIILKELRETHICLRIIVKSNLIKGAGINDTILKECVELISIFQKTVKTAKSNNKRVKS